MKTQQAKLLCVEGDEKVLAAHVALFSKMGHNVQPALGRKAAEQAVLRQKFDIVVLGHSLTRDDRHHLPYITKKAHEDCAVLVLHASGHHHAVDMALDSRDGDHKILQAVAELLSRQPVGTR